MNWLKGTSESDEKGTAADSMKRRRPLISLMCGTTFLDRVKSIETKKKGIGLNAEGNNDVLEKRAKLICTLCRPGFVIASGAMPSGT